MKSSRVKPEERAINVLFTSWKCKFSLLVPPWQVHSKENTFLSERQPIHFAFLNGSITNKYIYKLFQIECLINVVYTLNTCV